MKPTNSVLGVKRRLNFEEKQNNPTDSPGIIYFGPSQDLDEEELLEEELPLARWKKIVKRSDMFPGHYTQAQNRQSNHREDMDIDEVSRTEEAGLITPLPQPW